MSSPVSVKVLKDVDPRKFDELRRRLGERMNQVKVGVPMGKTEEDGTPLALVAATHEFGSPEHGIPERSFLRTAIRRNLELFIRLNRINIVKVVKGMLTMDQALGQLGAFAVGKVQEEIRNGQFVPLSPVTIARKGSSKPLIDTGQLLNGIEYEIGEH